MITMTKRLEFDYGHRLLNHGGGTGRCSNVHGHRGAVEITCELGGGGVDNTSGMVVDFGVVKQRVGGYIDEFLDHTFIANAEDEDLISYISRLQEKPVYVVGFEPTSENLASHLLAVSSRLLWSTGVSVVQVVFYETPTSRATATHAGMLMQAPCHPGEMILAYMESMNEDNRPDLEGHPLQAVTEGNSSITPELADELEALFNRPAHFWLNLQHNYDRFYPRAPFSARVNRW